MRRATSSGFVRHGDSTISEASGSEPAGGAAPLARDMAGTLRLCTDAVMPVESGAVPASSGDAPAGPLADETAGELAPAF